MTVTTSNTYPQMTGAEARNRIAQDREAELAIARSQDRELTLSLFSIFRQHGYQFGAGFHQIAEAARVTAILRRDQRQRVEDELRESARDQLQRGALVSLADTVLGPTEEWLAKGGTIPFTPRLPDHARHEVANTAKTVRRAPCPVARKMMLQGVIDYEGYMACCWLAEIHDAAGLSGNIPSTDYQKEIFVCPQGGLPFTQYQIEQQDLLKLLWREIPSKYMRLLIKMVVEDVPINRAVRAARAFHRDPKRGFSKAVDALCSVRAELKRS